MRRGITPVVAIVLLLMMTVAAAGGAYAWMGQVQGEAQDEADTALATAMAVRDVQCFQDTVQVALTNDGDTELAGSGGSAYLSRSGGRLVGDNGSIDLSPLTAPGSVAWRNITFPAVMEPGLSYTLDVETRDGVTATGRCTAERWWKQPFNGNLGADGSGNAVTHETVTVDRPGWYKVSYGAAWDNDIDTAGRHYMRNWVEKEGSTVTPGETICYIRGRNEERGDRCSNSGTMLVEADAGDTLALRGERYSGSNGETVTTEDSFLYAHRIRDPVAQVWDTTGGQDYDGSNITVNLDTATRVDGPFTFDASSDSLQVDESGTYRVYYTVNNDDTGQGNRQTVRSWLRLNGNAPPPEHPVEAYSYLRNTGSFNHQTGIAILDLSAGDELEIRQGKEFQESSGSSETMADRNWLLVEQLPTDDVLHVVAEDGGQRVSSGTTDSIMFDTTVAAGDRFGHSGSQVTIQESGWYEVGYTFAWDDGGGTGRHGVTGWLRKNGDTVMRPSEQHDYSRGDGGGEGRRNGIAANTVHRFEAGDTLELRVNSEGGYADVVGDGAYMTVTPLVP